MKVKFGCLLLLFTACFFCFSYAQTTSSVIRGNVFLQNNAAAEAATVILLNRADSSIATSALVDAKGSYQFLYVRPGGYLVLATRLGYQKTYSAMFQLAGGQQLTVKPITLTPLSKDLAEVAIVGKKQFVEVKPGKTIINPQASITADGKNVLDILSQSPGVRVDNNDNISISGRQHALILIDGKTTNMTGSDLASLLRSTQGNTVDRMELITGGSAKYDAAAGGVINIILKKGKNIGTNGTINLSAGYGKYYKSLAGITFNHRSKSVNVFGSYGFIGNKTYKYFTNDRNVNFAGVRSNYFLAYNGVQDLITHNYRLGADFALSPNHTLGVQVFGFVNNNNFVKDNKLKISNQGKLDSTILVGSTVDRDLRNENYNLNYTGKLGAGGKTISANITYSPYERGSDEYISNQFLNAAGATYRPDMLLQNLSPSDRKNYTALMDYAQPLGKTGKLELGAKYSHSKSNNTLVFGPQVNGRYLADPNFSNRFIYRENVAAGYVNYNGIIGKVDITLGLRGENTFSEGNSLGNAAAAAAITTRKYFNLFPNLLLHYAYSPKHDYSLTFTRGINRPDFESLNPFLYYIDPYNFQTGNPYLKPEFSNTLTFTHTYNESITTSLYAGLTTDANFTLYRQNDTTKVNLTTMRNIGRIKNIGIRFNAPYTVTKWWSGSIDIDAAYLRYTTYPENGTLNNGTADIIITPAQNFKLTRLLSAEISGRYETANQYGIRRFSPNYYVNAAVSMPVLNKLGKLSLNVADIFNTNRDRAYTNFQNIDLRVYDKRETRIVRLNFSYRFGKTTVKGATSHTTGNEDEQNRMKRVFN